MKRIAPFSLLAACLLLVTGCGTANFSTGISTDRHSFSSTPSLPLTFVLRDTVEGKELMRLDIPINKTLVVDLDHDNSWVLTQSGSTPATEIYWDFVDISTKITGPLQYHKKLPGNDVMMKLEVRPRESVAMAKTPTYQPSSTQAAQEQTSGAAPAAPVYHPVEPQPKPEPAAEPAPAPSSESAKPQAAPASSSGNKVNLPVEQGPAVRDTPKYTPHDESAEPAQPSQPSEPTQPSEPGEDLDKALD